MSGVWVFKNGVVRLVENGDAAAGGEAVRRRKALLHTESGQVVRSYAELESELRALGWERYYGEDTTTLLQFHKRGSLDMISLPADFARFSSVHMYDIVIKNREAFRVVDV
ncbi:hypothetical protein HU200_009800 [Digitaria exilis]|uniref:Uncharacterized protein n=1 Tax=Digitaria exilis TaxID=1010633 RepID=A0A835FJN1_9POAL|nr:hypothetical protein HU200_009800 [Digitaria exilis]CAB3476757.1 unnamed protein product [Digitaria exilis]